MAPFSQIQTFPVEGSSAQVLPSCWSGVWAVPAWRSPAPDASTPCTGPLPALQLPRHVQTLGVCSLAAAREKPAELGQWKCPLVNILPSSAVSF